MLYKIIRKFIHTLLWILSPLTAIIKRDPHLWAFGSNNNRYDDNAKYLFEYVSGNYKEIRAYWISGNRKLIKSLQKKGFKALWRYSIKGMFVAAKAGAHIYCHNLTDINQWLKKGALKLNLWHGIPIKKIGADIDRGPLKKTRHPEGILQKLYALLHSPHLLDHSFYLLSSSQEVRKKFCSAFEIPIEQIIVGGYPRHDPFFNLRPKPPKWKEFEQVVLYMPTFRDGNKEFLTLAIPSALELNQKCVEKNILFVIKLHPITPRSELNRLIGYSNIEIIDNEIDVYPLLPHTNTLITDYSSVLFDYLILNKGILIYAPDLEDYMMHSREFYYNISEWAGKNLLKTSFELLSAIEELNEKSINRDKLRLKIWEKDSNDANLQITNWLLRKLKNKFVKDVIC